MPKWESSTGILSAVGVMVTVSSGILYFSIKGDIQISKDSVLFPISGYVIAALILLSGIALLLAIPSFYYIIKTENSGEDKDKRKAVVATNLQLWPLLMAVVLFIIAAVLNVL